MRKTEKIVALSNYDFNGNVGLIKVGNSTRGAEYVFNQYEPKPWTRRAWNSGVLHNPVRGFLKIDMRNNRVSFNTEGGGK